VPLKQSPQPPPLRSWCSQMRLGTLIERTVNGPPNMGDEPTPQKYPSAAGPRRAADALLGPHTAVTEALAGAATDAEAPAGTAAAKPITAIADAAVASAVLVPTRAMVRDILLICLSFPFPAGFPRAGLSW